MQVYLAARFDRRDQLRGYRAELNSMGIACTSRWLDNHGLHEGATYTPLDLARCATEDLDDIEAADVFVTFTETTDVGYTSGGRHVELGFALALNIPVLIVGPRENVFHDLVESEEMVAQVATWAQATAYLDRMLEVLAA